MDRSGSASGDQRRQARRTVSCSIASPRTAGSEDTRAQARLASGRLGSARCDRARDTKQREQDPPASATRGSRHGGASYPGRGPPCRKNAAVKPPPQTSMDRGFRRVCSGPRVAVGSIVVTVAAARMTVARPTPAGPGGPKPWREPGLARLPGIELGRLLVGEDLARHRRGRHATPRGRRRADGSRSRSHRRSRHRAKSSSPPSSVRAAHGSSRTPGRSASK